MTKIEVTQVAEREISKLKNYSYEELSALESCESKRITVRGKSMVLTVWKDAVENHQIRVVVQIYRHFFLGIGQMHSQGFLMNSKKEIVDLQRNELYEFT